MIKKICLVFVFCILLSGCSLSSLSTGQQQNTAASDKNPVSQTDKDKDFLDSDVKETTAQAPVTSDGSVEALAQIGKNFLYAAFDGDVDKMLSLCNETMATDIEKNAKTYIGTKTTYRVDSIDTMISPLGSGKYLLYSEVAAISNKDSKNSKTEHFSYYLTAEKVKGDYFIVKYDRTKPTAAKTTSTQTKTGNTSTNTNTSTDNAGNTTNAGSNTTNTNASTGTNSNTGSSQR